VALPDSSIIKDDHRYVVNLESSTKPIVVPPLRNLVDAGQYVIYTSRFELDGRMWNRLRVGFFSSPGDAQLVLDAFKTKFPHAWVAVATDREVADALAQVGTALPPARAPQTQLAIPETERTIQVPDLSGAREPLEWVEPPVVAPAVIPTTPTETASQQADTETPAPITGAASAEPSG
jgi:hypothetical protein